MCEVFTGGDVYDTLMESDAVESTTQSSGRGEGVKTWSDTQETNVLFIMKEKSKS